MKKLIMACLFLGMSCSSFGLDNKEKFFDLLGQCVQDHRNRDEKSPELVDEEGFPKVWQHRNTCLLAMLHNMRKYQEGQDIQNVGIEIACAMIETYLAQNDPNLYGPTTIDASKYIEEQQQK